MAKHLLMTFTVLLLCAFSANAQEAAVTETAPKALTVDEIVNRANLVAYYQGQDGKARVSMTITDKNKNERNREFIILRKDWTDGGEQRYFVYFQRPADVRKMVFMVHKHPEPDRDDDRWLYLPSLDLVKRIAASDKRTSFVGSDFLYEDVSGRALTEDVHELVETTDEHYLVKNTPKDPKQVEFAYYNVFINRKTFIPMKMEYYDDKGKVYRRIEVLKVQTIQKYPTVLESRVTDLRRQSETVMVFSDVQYDLKLDDIFNERYLRRPPREAMR